MSDIAPRRIGEATSEPAWVRRVLIAVASATAVGRFLPHAGKILTPVYALIVVAMYVFVLLVTRELGVQDLNTIRAVVSKRRTR